VNNILGYICNGLLSLSQVSDDRDMNIGTYHRCLNLDEWFCFAGLGISIDNTEFQNSKFQNFKIPKLLIGEGEYSLELELDHSNLSFKNTLHLFYRLIEI
jgi:hypothetical protein